MKIRGFKILFVLSISALLSSPALAQTATTGSLSGTISDQKGESLPGCMLTITSPALMGTKTFVSTEEGRFRFPTLPAGTYVLVAEMPGFKKVTTEGIIVSIGKTSTIAVTMEQSVLKEEVKVTAISPAVDIKSNKKSVSYTANLLENIPIGRSMEAVVQSAPGEVGPASHGATNTSNRYYLDGVDMTNPGTGGAMTELSFDLYDEVELQTGAHPAEVGNVPGAYINIVTKSGGNTFHGALNGYYFNENFVDRNFTREQLDSFKVSSPSMDKHRNDFSLTVGGPIIKDKFWFFVSGRYLDSASAVAGFPVEYTHNEGYGFGKLSFQASKNLKLVGYFNWVRQRTPYTGASSLRTPQACADFIDESVVANGQINWILSQNAYVDIRAMYVDRPLRRATRPDATWPNNDQSGLVSGSYRWDDIYGQGRYMVMASSTIFLDNFLAGYHELKIGGDFEKAYSTMDVWMKTPQITTFSASGTPYLFGNFQGQFMAWGYSDQKGPHSPNEKKYPEFKYAFYVQDNWTIMDRLTLNLGLRYWHASGTNPAQSYVEASYWTWLNPDFFSRLDLPSAGTLIAFKGFSPRLGFSFDVFGNKKTMFKASFSRDYDYMNNTWHAGYRAINYIQYRWTDVNRDGWPNPGDTFAELVRFGRDKVVGDWYDPNLKSPWWNEYIIGIDHELLANFRLGVSYIYKHNADVYYGIEKNNKLNWATPYTVADPGYDGVLNTADDKSLTILDRTNPFEGTYYTNPSDAYRKYQALEIVFEKRMSNRWQLLGSIVYSKTYGTIGGDDSDPTGSAFTTPNYMINRDGRTAFDRPLVIKMQATYQLPYGFNLSGAFLASSGNPFARVLQVYAPKYGALVSVLAEPAGSRRDPSFNNLDLRLEKGFSLGGFRRLGLWIDVFNALNTASISIRSSLQGNITATGAFTKNATWLTVGSVSSPRSVRLGAKFTF